MCETFWNRNDNSSLLLTLSIAIVSQSFRTSMGWFDMALNHVPRVWGMIPDIAFQRFCRHADIFQLKMVWLPRCHDFGSNLLKGDPCDDFLYKIMSSNDLSSQCMVTSSNPNFVFWPNLSVLPPSTVAGRDCQHGCLPSAASAAAGWAARRHSTIWIRSRLRTPGKVW